jgi:hypothetical protein
MRAALAAAVALVAACSNPAKQPEPIGSSGSADPATTTPVVADGAAATANAGAQVEVHGTSEDAKLAPAIVTSDGVVIYCLDGADWGDKRNTAVVARGKLEQTEEFAPATGPNGEISAGIVGPVWVLRGCKVD